MRSYFHKAIKKLDRLSSAQISQLTHELYEENLSLKTILSCLPGGIIACTLDYCPWYINRNAQHDFDISAMNTQMPIWHQVRRPALQKFLQSALQTKQYVNNTHVASGGQVFSLSIEPLASKGRISGWLIVAGDITYQLQEISLRRGDESLAQLTNMTAILAHEVRNPLLSISIHLQLIKTYQNQAGNERDIDECLNIIREEVEHLNAVTSYFLSTARPMEIHPAPKDISQILEKTAALIRPEIEEHQAHLSLRVLDHPLIVSIDEDMLRLALTNLLRNALAALPAQGGRIYLGISEEEHMVKITVCDNGSGIPLQQQEKIFEPYFTTKENGSGLGLTLVYKVIKEHAGSISVLSPPAENQTGTQFTISLPKGNYEKLQLPLPVLED